MKASIIIPNLNSPYLDKTLESVLNQVTNIDFEVILVGIDKYGLANRYENSIKYIKLDCPLLPGAARNLGSKYASGDLLLFIDSDAVAAESWIENHVQLQLSYPEGIILGGAVIVGKQKFLAICDNVSTFHEYMGHMPVNGKRQIPSVNMSIPKHLFSDLGGFSNKQAGEDSELCINALQNNIKIIFNPLPEVIHYSQRDSISQLLNHSYIFGYHSIMVDKNYSEYLNTSILFRRWFLLILFSPFIVLLLLMKILFIEKIPINYWPVIPVIGITKYTWCIGAMRKLLDSQK